MPKINVSIDVPETAIKAARSLAGDPLHMLTTIMCVGEYAFIESPNPGDFLQLEIPKGSGSITNWEVNSYWHASIGDGNTPSRTLHIKPSGDWLEDYVKLLIKLTNKK